MTNTDQMTTRLYWQDAYLTESNARVAACDGAAVVLDATPFHAHGGGQPGDTGLIGGIRVTDTRKSQDQRLIVHLLESELAFEPGGTVSAQIDWERRYALMRHHTLLHLVHLCVTATSGPITPGGTEISEAKARIEYPLKKLNLEAVQQAVRGLVLADLPAVTSVGPDGVRIWAIPEHEQIPCGGTHVAQLSELGHVELWAKSAGRRGIRIYAASTPTAQTD